MSDHGSTIKLCNFGGQESIGFRHKAILVAVLILLSTANDNHTSTRPVTVHLWTEEINTHILMIDKRETIGQLLRPTHRKVMKRTKRHPVNLRKVQTMRSMMEWGKSI